jgi:hypothetical protein
MFKKLRIIIWSIVSELEQRLYPYYNDDDYYYEVKNDDTGEKYMIIEWIKSFDERISRLQDEMVWIKSELQLINKNKNG